MWFNIFGKSKGTSKISRQAKKVIQEDLIKALYAHKEALEGKEAIFELGENLGLNPKVLTEAIGQLSLDGYLLVNPYQLTEKGQKRALQLIRQHRIYELYLAEHSGYNAEEWHTKAEDMEHKLSEEEVKELEKLLGHPLFDPHGDPIPNAELNFPKTLDDSEKELFEGQILKVLHIEDDDVQLFREVHQTGLARHSLLRIESLDKEQFSFLCEGELFSLPNEALEILTLTQASEEDIASMPFGEVQRLSKLQEGELAEIIKLSPSCRGAMRRRLMDLGFVRGSVVQIDMTSPMDNPVAYVVRGAAIALRADQARYILVKKLPK